MLPIGEFSKICEVSTKTLRYYDEFGLIHPDHINPDNGYRYYSIHQLKKMLYINRLKSYHFSLDEIKELINGETDPSEDKLRHALHRKRKEIQEKLSRYEDTLVQMNLDIANLEQGIHVMAYLDEIEVQLVETESMNILYDRHLMSREEYAQGYGRYYSKLYEQIARGNLTLAGTPLTIYHSEEFNPAGNDTEFALPVKESVKGTRELCGSLCARSVLKGSYSNLTSVYAKLREWIDQEGYVMTQSPYEVYVTDPYQTSTTNELVTEVCFPVAKK